MEYKLKKVDFFNISLLVIALLSYIVPFGNYKLFLWAFIGFTSFRVMLLLKRKILWKTRNRLVFSGLFFVITPLFFTVILFFIVAIFMAGQYGITIMDNMMDMQLKDINEEVNRKIDLYQKDPLSGYGYFKGEAYGLKNFFNMKSGSGKKVNIVNFLNLIYFQKKSDGTYELIAKYGDIKNLEKVKAINQVNGYFLLDKILYHGLITESKHLKVLSAIKVNQAYLSEYISKINDFSIQFKNPGVKESLKDKLEADMRERSDSGSFLVVPIRYSYKYRDLDSENPLAEKTGGFFIRMNIGQMYQKWKHGKSFIDDDSNVFTFIYALIGMFLFFIIISFMVGFKILRVITKSINQLTKGTHKIRNGDFSFRIKIRSKDQLQYLAESFNEMASGINRLLIEEKEKHRLEEELRIARTIQEKLLPYEQYETDNFQIAAINIPAEEIAGDYFDYYYKNDEYLMLILADVSGKGASAAFYMAELKGVNNHLRKTDISPAKLTAEFHHSLYDTFDKVTFITISIAKFNIREKQFIFSRAGHTKGIYYNREEDLCQELSPSGIAIGVPNFSEDRIKEITLDYHSGDVLVLFSDGLSEIMNKSSEMYGIERIIKMLELNKEKSANEIKDAILSDSEIFAENIPNHDDLTLMVLKVK